MRRLFARLLTSSARLFHAVVNHLLGRRARRAQAATGHRARLLLAPMENRDHTGQLAGGVVLAALGCQLTDPLQGMALAVGDLAMLAAPPAEAASQPTVGDPPRPLTRWLPDDWNAAALAFSAEGQSSGSASADNEADQLAAARAIDPLDNFWAIPVAGASFEAAPALPPLPAPDGAAPPGPNSSDGVTAIGASGTLPPLGEVPAAPAPREGEPGRAPDQPAQHVGSLNRSEQTEPDLTPEPFSIAANALAQLPETPDQLLNNQLASPDSIFVQSVHRYGQGAGSRLFVAGLVQTSATAGTPLTIDFASEGRLLGSTPVTADGSGATGFQTVLPATANEQAVVATVRGGASSAPVSVTAAPDGDLDGVPDWIEARVPGRSGDANLPGVASLPLGTGDAYATIDAGTLRLTRVSTFTVPSSLPASTFSDGLFSFAVEGVTPGGLATITLTLPPGPRSGGYAKWDPVTNRVTDFSFDGTTGAVIDGNVITLTLQDGGRGDADGVVNGTILDPGGPSEAIGTIGDVVWIDDDGDGVQDPNEPGFPGVSVELYDPSGTMVLATTTTNTGGQYTFSAIGGADYRVKFILPSGYQFSPQHTGSDATDSDADPGTGLTPAFFLPTGGAVNAADAGMRPPGPAVITGRVWDDSDGDGVQNPSEGGGPEGAVVRLYDESGTTLLTTTGIGNNGSYSFTAVSGTYYRIEVVRTGSASGYAFSPANVGGDATDSDTDPSTGRTAPFYLTLGGSTIDAGLHLSSGGSSGGNSGGSGSYGWIGDRVWSDTDGDGVQDLGEAGVGDVTVRLYDSTGVVLLGTTTTDPDGSYLFAGLGAGTYRVQFVAPSGYQLSPQYGSGSTAATDSDPDPSTGLTNALYLIPGGYTDTVDAGVFPIAPAVITGRVWGDADADGVQDSNETGGPEGVTVYLYDQFGMSVLATTTTDSEGEYTFTRSAGAASGAYRIAFVRPSGYLFSPTDIGSDTTDSDANSATGFTGTIYTTPGATTRADAGVYLDKPVVTVTATDPSATEAGNTGTYRIDRTGSTTAPLVVYFQMDGSAAAPGAPNADYALDGPTEGPAYQITIPANQSFVVVTLTPTADSLVEGDETARLVLSTDSTYVVGAQDRATVTVVAPVPVVQFGAATYQVTEGGSVAVTITLSLASAQTVTVNYQTEGVSAQVGADYQAASGALTFAPGETTKTIQFTTADDLVWEGEETFRVVLSAPSGATLGATATEIRIADDEPAPQFTFTQAAFETGEWSPTATVTVQLSAPASRELAVSYTTANGTATAPIDYTATAGTLVFSPGQTSKTFTVTIAPDTQFEPTEVVALHLTNPTGGAELGEQDEAEIRIADDDPAPQVGFSSQMLSAAENSGSVQIAVTLSAVSGSPVTVEYAVRNGTAMAPTDFIAATGTLTFAPGQTSRTFTVAIADDTIAEGAETVFLSLSSPTGARLGFASAVLTINDNEAPPQVQFATSAVTAAEGQTAVVTVRLTSPYASPVSVQYAATNGTATLSDYAAAAGTLVFAPGETERTFEIALVADGVWEGQQTVTLGLSAPTGGVTLGSPSAATLFITDGDAPPEVRVGSGTFELVEGTAGDIEITLSRPAEQVITVGYATADQTATAGADYTPLTGYVTFAPGATTQTVRLTALDDTTSEGAETFTVGLTSAPAGITIGAPAVVTITDDDDPTVGFVLTEVTTPENGGAVALTVRLSRPAPFTVTVPYSTFDGTATESTDYAAGQGELTFAPGVTEQVITVALVSDATPEEDETFTVTLGQPTGAALDSGWAEVTVIDDDAAPRVRFQVPATRAAEGTGSVNLTVTLSAPAATAVTVAYATVAGTATPGTDFTPASGSITFSPGQTTATISVWPVNDATAEPDEVFTVQLSAPVGAVIESEAAVVTIADDELAAAGQTLATTQGRSAPVTLATVTSADPLVTAADLSARIEWGDGTVTAGTVEATAGGFAVRGWYAYPLAGEYVARVTVTHSSGAEVQAVTAVQVTASPIVASPEPVSVNEGAAFNGAVASFHTAKPNPTAADFVALIEWGDGSSGAGTLLSDGAGGFTVHGAHTYVQFGALALRVRVTDADGDGATVAATAEIADAPITAASASLASGTQGVVFEDTVATFTDANPGGTPGDFEATIDWGDGSTSVGTVEADGAGGFRVVGSHAYRMPGAFTVGTRIEAPFPGTAAATVSAPVTVADAPLVATSAAFAVASGQEFSGTVATFTDGNPLAEPTDFAATVNWGDGSTGTGTVVRVAPGQFRVVAAHPYTTAGARTVTVTVTASDGGSAVADSAAQVTDSAATVGQPFTFSTTFSAPGALAEEFTALINWGDGGSTAGTITALGDDLFRISGVHTFATVAAFTVTATATRTGDSPVVRAGTVAVSDAPLVPTVVTVAVAEGQPFNGVVATFAYAATGTFVAVIEWEPGETTTGTVTSLGNGLFQIAGQWTYKQAGSSPVRVTVTSPFGTETSASGSATVTDASLTATGQAVQADKGTLFDGIVATFADANPFGEASDFTATIDWGDGTASVGTVQEHEGGGFEVAGLHRYGSTGTHTVTVTITSAEPGTATASATATATVAAAQTTVTGEEVSAGRGVALSGVVVATFTTADADADTIDFTASIDWGDGTTSSGTVEAGESGFRVTGTHTYTSAGAFTATVIVTGPGGAQDQDNATVRVGTMTATEGQSTTGTVLTFARPGAAAGEFTTVIHWGDGETSPGAVTADGANFVVAGTHTYRNVGYYPVSVELQHNGGSPEALASGVFVLDAPLSVAVPPLSAVARAFTIGPVATFTDANPFSTPDDFLVVIEWGDGSMSAGEVTGGNGTFQVRGLHSYLINGAYPVAVTVRDVDGGAASGSATATVGRPGLAVVGETVQVLEGAVFNGLVATFLDPDPAADASQYGATIFWGDGTSSAGTVFTDGSGRFEVWGVTQYNTPGGYVVSVSVTQPDGPPAVGRGLAVITDAPIVTTDLTVGLLVGLPALTLLARFTDGNPNSVAGNFTARVDWGDGTRSDGQIVKMNGQFEIQGGHKYAREGLYALGITLTDRGSGQVYRLKPTALVADRAVDLTVLPINTVEGRTLTDQTVARFTHATVSRAAAEYAATIDWGDGTAPTEGVIKALGNGAYAVLGTHTYTERRDRAAGDFAFAELKVTVTTVKNGLEVSESARATVGDAALVAAPKTFEVIQGQPYLGSVVRFTDANKYTRPQAFTAMIDWGDGTPATPGRVRAFGDGVFEVTSPDTYLKARPGTTLVTVTITDIDGSSAVVTSFARRLDALTISGTGANVVAPARSTFSGTIATFTVNDPLANATDYTATIDWGDFTPSSAGKITKSGATFTVTGTHTVGRYGAAPLRVTVTGPGGATATVAGTILIDRPAIAITVAPVTAIETIETNQIVATFTDSLNNQYSWYYGYPVSDYKAQVDWGDGTISEGNIQWTEVGTYQVWGGHTYAQNGQYSIRVTVNSTLSGASAAGELAAAATVGDMAESVRGPQGLWLSSGEIYQGLLTEFYENVLDPKSNYTASVDWGDGTASPAIIYGANDPPPQYNDQSNSLYTWESSNYYYLDSYPTQTDHQSFYSVFLTSNQTYPSFRADGSFRVFGQPHAYSGTGSYTITVTITDAEGSATTRQIPVTVGSAAVAPGLQQNPELSVSVNAISAEEGAFRFYEVASFTDSTPVNNYYDNWGYHSIESRYVAFIDWGDGATELVEQDVTAVGELNLYQPRISGMKVFAGHTYNEDRSYTVRVWLVDKTYYQYNYGLNSPTYTTWRRGAGTATITQRGAPVPAELTVSLALETATIGQELADVTVASFTTTGSSEQLDTGSFWANISWGDGSTSTGQIHGANGSYTVTGSHTYTTSGAKAFQVSVTRVNDTSNARLTGAATGTIIVPASPPSGSSGYEVWGVSQSTGVGGGLRSAVLAGFTTPDAPNEAPLAAYSVTIEWGDGITDTGGAILRGEGNKLYITGSHAYAQPGTYKALVKVRSSAAEVGSAIATIIVHPAVAGTPTTFAPAQFQNPNGLDWSIQTTINWGDGTLTSEYDSFPSDWNWLSDYNYDYYTYSNLYNYYYLYNNYYSDWSYKVPVGNTYSYNIYNGTVPIPIMRLAAKTEGVFAVSGSHIYASAGTKTIETTAVDKPTNDSTTQSITVTIADAPAQISALLPTVPAVQGVAVTTPLARVFDYNFYDGGDVGRYTARVVWGDGSAAETAELVLGSDGVLTVCGSHQYAREGRYNATVFLFRSGQSTDLLSAISAAGFVVEVTDPSWEVSAQTVGAIRGLNPGPMVVGYIREIDALGIAAARATDYTATIYWGDGGASSGTVVADGAGQFKIIIEGTFFTSGLFDFKITVSDKTSTRTALGTVAVIAAALDGGTVTGQVRENDPDRTLSIPLGTAAITPGTGGLQLAHGLDFDLSPGATVGGSPALVYNSDTAAVRPIVEFTLNLPEQPSWAGGPAVVRPTGIDINLYWEGEDGALGAPTPYHFTPTANDSPTSFLLAAMAGAPVTRSGFYSWRADVVISYMEGPEPFSIQFQSKGETPVVVRSAASGTVAVGNGWGIAGVDQLVIESGPTQYVDRFIMTYGTGDYRVFTETFGTSNTYTSAGDFGTLTWNASTGEYTYTALDQTRRVFDAQGRLTAVIDRHQKALTYQYDANGRLQTVEAPDGGHTQFAYTGGTVVISEPGNRTVTLTLTNGELQKITDPADPTGAALPAGVTLDPNPNPAERNFTYTNGKLTRDAWAPRVTNFEYTFGRISGVELGSGLGSKTLFRPAAVQGLPGAIPGRGATAADAVAVIDGPEEGGFFTPSQERLVTYTLDRLGRALRSDTVWRAVTLQQNVGYQLADQVIVTEKWDRNAVGQVTTYTDRLRRATQYKYDPVSLGGGLRRITNPDDTYQEYDYHPVYHFVTRFRDEAGKITLTTYTAEGDLETVENALGEETTSTWTDGLLRTVQDALDRVTTYQYDAHRRLEVVIDALGNRTTYAYDATGNVRTVTDALGNATTTVYDGRNQLRMAIDAEGGRVRSTYNADGSVASTFDARGTQTAYQYDARGWTQSVTEAVGQPEARRTNWEYDAVGNVTAVTSGQSAAPDTVGVQRIPHYGQSSVTTYAYDSLGNRIGMTEGAGWSPIPGSRTSTFTYDKAGQLRRSINALGVVTAFDYDVRGRQTEVYEGWEEPNPGSQNAVLAFARATKWEYDAVGNVVRMFTGISRRDALTGGATITLAEQLAKPLADPQVVETWYEYDSLHRVVRVHEAYGKPEGRMTETKYDEVGNVVRVITGMPTLGTKAGSARPTATRFEYDALNRLTKTVEASGTADQRQTVREYDAVGNVVTEYDALNRRTDYAYDKVGRRTAVWQGVTFYLLGVRQYDRASYYEYDPSGNLVTFTTGLSTNYKSAKSVTTYAYDRLNRQTGATDGANDPVLLRRSTTRYDAADNVTQITSGESPTALIAETGLRYSRPVVTRFEYDEFNQRIKTYEEQRGPYSEAVVLLTEEKYDAVGNLSSRTVREVGGGTFDRTYFRYDQLNRLVEMYQGASDWATGPKAYLRGTRFEYDTADNRRAVVTGLSSGGDGAFALVGGFATDPIEARTEFEYDALNRLVTQRDGLGPNSTASTRRVTTIAYDTADNQVSVTNAIGVETKFVYDNLGRLRQTIQGNSVRGKQLVTPLRTSRGYDGADRVLWERTALGAYTIYEYDSLDHRVAVYEGDKGTTPNGNFYLRQTAYTYDADDNAISMTVMKSANYQITATSTMEYDVHRRLVRLTEAVGTEDQRITLRAYDAADNLMAVIDGRAKGDLTNRIVRTAYEYDSRGHQTRATAPDGSFTQAVYDARGQLRASTDAGGNTTTYTYDALGQVRRIESPAFDGLLPTAGEAKALPPLQRYNVVTTFVYNAAGNQLGRYMGASNGQQGQFTQTWTTYDILGRITREMTDSNTTINTYDVMGNVIKLRTPEGNVTTFRYDLLGHRDLESKVIRVRKPTGAMADVTVYTLFYYNANGTLRSTYDPQERGRAFTYDRLGRVTEELRFDSPSARETLRFTYNSQDNIETASSAAGKITITYDYLFRVKTETDVYGVKLTSTYDLAGNRKKVTDSLGGGIRSEYDVMNRLTGREVYITTPGQLGQVADRLGFSQTWTKRGQVETRTAGAGQWYQDPNTPGAGTLESFDNPLYPLRYRVETILTSLATIATYTYDPYGQLSRLEEQVLASFAPLDFTQKKQKVTSYYYGPNGRLSLELWNTDLTKPVDADVDPKKNRKAVTYQYDATGQVTTGAAATYSYNGTRREKVVVQDGDKTKEFDYVYGKSNEILSDGRYTYQYDLSGNRIKKEQIKSEVIDGERQNKEWSYRFDALGRVTEVVEYNRRTQLALTSTFRYDALGRLVSTFASQATKTNGTANVVERYVYDGANVYIDLAGNFGAPVTTAAARYLRGDTTDDIVGRFSSAESRLYLTDRLGSVRNVITKSATADYATLVTYTYETFGARQAVDKKGDRIAPADVKGPWDRYGYTGRELDRLSGLQHNRARWYDSWTGQWLSQDPIGFAGGDTNLYRYVGNDPVNKTDPSGRLAHVVVTAAVGTVIGGLVGGIGTYLETGDLSEAAGAAARGALVGFVSGTAAGLTGGASLLVSGAVGAAAGNIVSQGIEVADGKRDSFSWKEFGVQTVTGAIGAGIGGGIGKGLSKLTGINVAGQAACRQAIAQQVVRSVNGAAGGFVGDGVTQLGMIGAGLQKEFNWTQSILAAAGGAAGELMTYRMTRACFTAGTPLLTPSGAKPIEQFQVGDVLFSRDEHNLEGPVEPKVVEEVFIRHAPVLFLHIGGRRIGTTGEHPFWVRDKGWLPANQIVAGDHLVGHDNQWIVVHAVEATDEYQTVYNLRIADHHTYFVGKEEWGWSVWAHNSNICILGTPEEVVAQDRVSALLIPLEAHIEAHPTSWHRTGQPSGIKRNGAFSISEVRTAQDTHELLVSMNGPGRTNDMWQQIIREEFGLVHEQSINDDGLTLRFVRDELPVPTDTRLNDAEMHIARVATREGSEMLAIGATRNTCMFCQHRLLFSYNLPRNRIITPFNEHTAGAPRDFYDALGHSLPKNQQDFHGSEG